MMEPRRIATAAILCATVALTGWRVIGLASLDIDKSSAALIEVPHPALRPPAVEHAEESRAMPTGDTVVASANPAAPIEVEAATAAAATTSEAPAATTLSAAVEQAEESPDIPAGNMQVASADAAAVPELAAATASGPAAASDEPGTPVEVASPDAAQRSLPETTTMQLASLNTPDPLPNEIKPNDAKEALGAIEIVGECLVVEPCIDQYLWALYQRTPKEDTNKVLERRQVAVKRKGKMVMVTRSFTKLVDSDFTWKDPNAAERARMPMMDYVIGGMDRGFKLKLFHLLQAAEQAGLSPGITSAFRDDYRQSIASGLKAATDRSFHGGSLRGGYGHGLAADVVGVKGGTRDDRWRSSETLWKWIDANGMQFGIGRPYLGRDPPHVAPTDGKEYAAKRGGTKVQHAAAAARKHTRLASRDDHGVAKRVKTAKSSKVKTTQAGSATRPGTARAKVQS